jgi:pyruvate kinase
MAVEAGNEVVPIVQRKLIALCRQYGKIVIVATQMMGSMVENPEPSRAEVSDVANAVIQGADAVMLSDETANGKYPIEAVKQMKKVILYTQNHTKVLPIEHEQVGEYENYDAVAHAAARLAEEIEADVIVCQTSSGATAAAIAAQRPNVPIITVTSNARVAGQLALTYANSAFVRSYTDTYGLDLAQELAASDYLKKRDDRDYILAVIVSGQPNVQGGTDTIQIRRV